MCDVTLTLLTVPFSSHTIQMPKFTYPLSSSQIAVFRDFFRQKFGNTLHYTSEQMIQSAFLEFQDVEGDDGSSDCVNQVMDVLAMTEDLHCSLRQQAFYTAQIAASMRPCVTCSQTGVNPKTGLICATCGGTGRRSKKTRA